jgi:hypothetical protein
MAACRADKDDHPLAAIFGDLYDSLSAQSSRRPHAEFILVHGNVITAFTVLVIRPPITLSDGLLIISRNRSVSSAATRTAESKGSVWERRRKCGRLNLLVLCVSKCSFRCNFGCRKAMAHLSPLTCWFPTRLSPGFSRRGKGKCASQRREESC